MINNLCIGPVSSNLDTVMKLAFGNNVSASSVIEYVERNAKAMEACGLITEAEAVKMIEEVEKKIACK